MRNAFFKDVWGCLLLIGFLLALQGCSVPDADDELLIPDLNNAGMVEDSLSADMVRILATGRSAVLGSENGKSNERPVMTVKFDYDFSIGLHEVTCGEFNAMDIVKIPCENDSLPAANVTYYDVVLFANARSAAEKLDSAYSYDTKSLDGEGHCIGLQNFKYLPEAQGYRLPTEAEWTLVASTYWNSEKSWHAENSGYTTHQVCSVPDASLTLNRVHQKKNVVPCDMAGNVMEWVNDWLGYFRDTTILNYAGAPDGGSLGERVVKGGSYRNTLNSLSVYSRGDIYTVTSSTKAEYVGFRLAKGAIPDVTWMSSNGTASASRVVPVAEASVIRGLTGTFRTKMAFRNDVSGNLVFLDYGLGSLSVVEIPDTIEVYHPDISPDGQKVAFCTKPEGVGGVSSLYVRNLDAAGSNLVRLDVESAAIPRWKVVDGDTSIVYVTSAASNKDDASFSQFSTWIVKFEKGKFGTPKKLMEGNFHGGISDDDRLAVTGARLLRARVARDGSSVYEDALDTIWYNGEQACNVSLANDGSKRTLFLDFGGKTGEDFVGSKYQTHQRLLVMDSTGKLIHSVAAPKGYTFDHSEWVSRNLAVVTLADINGAHTKIAMVNFRDDTVVPLIDGDELWHPSVSIDESFISPNFDSEVNRDSAGVYYDGKVWYNALELRVKMENFWYRRDEVTAVGIGSSRMMFGMYEKAVRSENFLNMAYSAGDMRGMHYLLKNYLLPHLKKLKVLVVEMSPDLLWYERATSWGPIIDGVPGFKYDEDHNFWVDGVPDDLLKAVSDCPKPESALQHPYNLVDFQLPAYGWYGVEVFRDTTLMSLDDPNYKEDFALFEDILRMAHEHGLTVICFVAPQNPGYQQTGSYGVYGPKRSVASSILRRVKEMDVIWMDENKMGRHDYTYQMAYNMDHLSGAGAAKLTARLDSLLQTLK